MTTHAMQCTPIYVGFYSPLGGLLMSSSFALENDLTSLLAYFIPIPWNSAIANS